jgi:hypothetical protein
VAASGQFLMAASGQIFFSRAVDSPGAQAPLPAHRWADAAIASAGT